MGTSSGIFGAVQGDSESAVAEKPRFEGTGDRLYNPPSPFFPPPPLKRDQAGRPELREQALSDLLKYISYTRQPTALEPSEGSLIPSVFMENTVALRGQEFGGRSLERPSPHRLFQIH